MGKWDEGGEGYWAGGVYEVMENDEGWKGLEMKGGKCVEWKRCDMKDGCENMRWVVGEGGGGGNYANM